MQVQPATTSFTTTTPNGESVSGRPPLPNSVPSKTLSIGVLPRSMLIIPFRDLFCFRREKAGGQTWEMYVEVCGRDLGVLVTGYICKALEWLELPPSLLQSDSS